MANVAIIGAQWGDEGKGKIVDLFTQDADIIVRFQGGNAISFIHVDDAVSKKALQELRDRPEIVSAVQVKL